MTGLQFADTRYGQRVVGNSVGKGPALPEGWTDNAPTDPTWKMGGSEAKTDWAMILMEPDTSLNLKSCGCAIHTYVQMFKKTEELVDTLKAQSVENLQTLIGLSVKSAKGHAERLQRFHTLPPVQASVLFGGERFRVEAMTETDHKWLGNHLRFISGLYGALRPFDDVKPVRDVPFEARLETKKGNSLVEFWGDSISKQVLRDIASASGGSKVLVVSLVSEEYGKALRADLFLKENMKFTQVVFEGGSDSCRRSARQEMGRWALRRRLSSIDEFHEWRPDDWKVDKFKSTETSLFFSWIGDVVSPKTNGKTSKKSKSKKDSKSKSKSRPKRDDSSDSASSHRRRSSSPWARSRTRSSSRKRNSGRMKKHKTKRSEPAPRRSSRSSSS